MHSIHLLPCTRPGVSSVLRLALVTFALGALAPYSAAGDPSSAPFTTAPDSTAAVLESLGEASQVWCVRSTLERARKPGEVREAARESALVDASVWMRLEREIAAMPVTTCRERPLVPGQSYSYAIRLTSADRMDRPRVEFDFRSSCVRLMRDGQVVGARDLRGSERTLVELFRRVMPRSEFLQKWAMAFEPPAPAPVAANAAEGNDDPNGPPIPVDELPEPIRKANPEYPDIARDAGVEGTVHVKAKVGVDGRVIRTHVEKGVPMLNDAAETAVRQWVFKPAMLAGQPVVVWVSVPIAFKLK